MAEVVFTPEELASFKGEKGDVGPQGPPGTEPGEVADLRNRVATVEGRVNALPDTETIVTEVLDRLRDLIPPEPVIEPPVVEPPDRILMPPGAFSSIDTWLDAIEAGAHGYIPGYVVVDAEDIRDRVLTGDFRLTVDGTLDFGRRVVGLGVNCSNLHVDGSGRVKGKGIAFLASPDKAYDGATGKDAFRGFIPELTKDIESVHLSLAEWDGCNPFVLINYAPAPKDFNLEKSKYRLKKFFFDGLCHDAPGGVILLTQRWGSPDAMIVSPDGSFTGVPAIEIYGKFTMIDGRAFGKEAFAGRAIVVGGNRESEDPGSTSGGLLIEADISDVYNSGSENETQGIRVESRGPMLIQDTKIRRVRNTGTSNDIAVSLAKFDSHGKPVNNCDGLYSKGPLVVVRTLLEDCDGAGFDAGGWTAKGDGPAHGRDLTFRWTRSDWRKVVNRVIRCNNHPDSRYTGIKVEGYGVLRPFTGVGAAFWARDGHPERRVTDYTILP